MSALDIGRQVNDLALAEPRNVPFIDGLVSSNLTNLENTKRHGDGHFTKIDVHVSVADLVGWDLLAKQWQTHSTLRKQLGGVTLGVRKFRVKFLFELTKFNKASRFSRATLPCRAPGWAFPSLTPIPSVTL